MQINIGELNKFLNKKIVLDTYNNSCILSNGHIPCCNNEQMHQIQCNFFVVPSNRSAIIEIPDCEWLKLLIVNCQTIDGQHKWQINEKTKKLSPRAKNNSNDNLYKNNKFNLETDYFVAKCKHRNRQGYKY